MTGTTLETFALVIVTAIVLAIAQEVVKKIISPKKDVSRATLFVTQTELDDFCRRNQEKCSALKIVEMIDKSMKELREELKQEMAELRKLVSRAALIKKNNGFDAGD